MKYIKAVCFFLSFVLCVCVGGCTEKETLSPDESITVRMGIWPDSSENHAIEAWEKYLALMKEKYPNINLEPAPISYSFEGIVAMAASGSLPTVFSVYFTEPARLVSNSFIADITEYAEEYGYLEGQRPELLELASFDGRQYGIVRDTYGMALLINMNLFSSAGLVAEDGTPIIPKTLEELSKAALTVKEKTGKAGFCISTKGRQGGWQFINLALAFGAEFEYTDASGRLVSGLQDSASVEAMKYLKRLRWELDVMPGTNSIALGDYISLFSNGEAAMVFAAPDSIKNMILSGSLKKDEVAVAPIPSHNSSASLMGGTMYVFSSAATDEQLDACFKFLQINGMTPDGSRYMRSALENELMNQAEAELAIFPAGVSVWTDSGRIAAENEIYKRFTNVDLRLFADYYEKIGDMLVPECRINCQDMYAALDSCIYEVLSNPDCDVERLMQDTAQSFESFYYG